MPKRHKDAPPEEDLYAPIEWQQRRRVRGHPLRDGRRDRQDHDRPARGPQRLPAPDPGRARATPSSCAREDPEVGAIIFTGAGDRGLLLRRRPAGPRRRRLHRRRRGRQQASAGFDVSDLHVQIRRLPKPVVAMVAGYAVGGGHILHLCLRPDDRRRQRRLRPDRAAGRHASTAASAPRCCAHLVGTKKAKEIWFLCRQYDAEEALEMGLVNTVVPLGRPRARDRRLVPRDARPLPFALRLLKASFNAHEDGLRRDPAARPRRHAALLLTRRARRGATPIKEGRQPDFSKFPRRP